jgi:hypothetical protein
MLLFHAAISCSGVNPPHTQMLSWSGTQHYVQINLAKLCASPPTRAAPTPYGCVDILQYEGPDGASPPTSGALTVYYLF